MSEDELMVFVASGACALLTWLAFLSRLLRVRSAHDVRVPRVLVVLSLPLCGAVFVLVLRFFASFDVQEDVGYTFFYVAMGAAFVGVATQFFAALGFCIRHDLGELGNRAVVPLVIGALLAFTLAFTGGNVGDGPGWWVVVVAASIAATALVVAWLVVDGFAGIAERATVERDLGAGLRGGALWVAMGLVVGRGAAGDYESIEATLVDFASIAWVLVPLSVGAIVVERVVGRLGGGGAIATVVAACAYLAVGATSIVAFGAP